MNGWKLINITLIPFVVLTAALLVSSSGCGHKADAAKTEHDSEVLPKVEVAPVSAGAIEQIIPVTGTLAVLRENQSTITPAVSGILDSVNVRFGQNVEKGQVVAHLSTRTLEGQIEQARATIVQNQVQVQQSKTNALQQHAQTEAAIRQSRASLLSAQAALSGAEANLIGNKAALHNAQQNLERNQQLLNDGLVSKKDVEAAQLAVDTAKAQVEAQLQTVAAARETVAGQRASLQAAQSGSLQDIVKRNDIQVAQQQVHNAKGALSTAMGQKSLYTLKSPISGHVVNVGVSVGETVDTTAKIVTIANTDQLLLDLDVPAESAGLLHVGELVRFTVEGTNKSYQATLQKVGTQIESGSNTVAVFATINNPGHKLVEGSFIRAQIIVSKHTGSLLVPKSAILRSSDGVKAVVVTSDNIAHVKDVKTGLTEADNVEILDGLQIKDRVVTTGNYGLPDGAKVDIAEGKTDK